MVSAQTILILGGVALFIFAGGVGLSTQAFGQVKTDFTKIKSGISKNDTIVNAVNRFRSSRENNPTDKAGEMIV